MPLNSDAIELAKKALALAADYSGFNAVSRVCNAGSVLVVCYHGIVPDECGRHPLWLPNMVPVTEFRKHLDELLRLFVPITPDDFSHWVHDDRSLPRNAVLLTFDDGYANNLVYAAPLLREFGVPAIFFITTGYIAGERLLWPTEVYLNVIDWPEEKIPVPGGDTVLLPPNEDARCRLAMQIEEVCKYLPPERFVVYIEKLRAVTKGEFRSKMLSLGTLQREMFSFLNWDEVRALQKAGFTIGSHTIEHPILTRISASQRTRELQESRARIASETGTECHYFAYPNGGERDVNPEVIQAVQQAGYDVAFTLTGRLCKRPCPPLSCERIWIPGRLSMSALRTRTSSAHTKIRNVLMHAWRNGTVDGGQDGPAIAKGATAANMADRTS